MTDLTPEFLARLRAMTEAATPGEWYVNRIKGYTDNQIETHHPDYVARKPWGHVVAQVGLCAGDASQSKFEADSEHIAAADPPTVLALLDEIKRLQEALEEAALNMSSAAETCERAARRVRWHLSHEEDA